MSNLKNEISREPPPGAFIPNNAGGTPILYAFGCALLENDLGGCYAYKAVNLETCKSVTFGRRKTPISAREAEKAAERIRDSGIAGAGRYEADRSYGKGISKGKCREILDKVFRDILPEHGYAIRNGQVALSGEILETLHSRTVALAEAEVGTGKTLAYLVAAIIAKRGRLNDFWNRFAYPEMSCVDMAHMPIVIATSSIALQDAIMAEYIPELSDILMAHGVIKTPITAALRKGREHYICERSLRDCIDNEQDPEKRLALQMLLAPKAPVDIAGTQGLDRCDKRKIAVTGKCAHGCPFRDSCSYRQFRQQASNPAIDIQVTNHNYFLADLKLREGGGPKRRPIIPNYQAAVIDEAHKFLSAARAMYGYGLSSSTMPEINGAILKLNLERESAQKLAREKAAKLCSESRRLFKRLGGAAGDGEIAGGEAARHTANIDKEAGRHLRNLRNIAGELYELLAPEPVSANCDGKKSDILWGLACAREQLEPLARNDGNIYWLEKPDLSTTAGQMQEHRLCAMPHGIDGRLHKNLWGRGIPAILTSGTLSAGGDFSHIKRTLGLHQLGNRLAEVSKPSPFDYRENAILYISEGMPFPDQSDSGYIDAIADETEKLIRASHGHAAVLFTSYKVMDKVWHLLSARGFPFPLFRMDKGGTKEIENFKKSGGGVLLASGALWEGIDIPGDALSLLIIVKLPFQAPDPIGEYEQSLYANMSEYKAKHVVPEMLIKLKQGFGRLIRTEGDTGAVAILDSRASSTGAYRSRVLGALPSCYVTADTADVRDFIRAAKPAEYFG